MNTFEVAKKIKDHLIQLAIDDKLPLDMNALDTYPIQQIIKEEEELEAYGFGVIDVLGQAKDDGVEITEEDAKEIIGWMRQDGDVSIGISWETITYFTQLYLDEKKNKKP